MFQRAIDSLNRIDKGQEVEILENFSDWNEVKFQLKSLEINPSEQFAIDLFMFSADRLIVQLHTLIILIKKV